MRILSTLTVLAIGAGMAALYMQEEDIPDVPAVQTTGVMGEDAMATSPELMLPTGRAYSAPANKPFASSPAAPFGPAATDTMAVEVSVSEEAPIVAVPAEPLLRSATNAGPIDTTQPIPNSGRFHFAPDGPMSTAPEHSEHSALGNSNEPLEAAEENAAPAPTYARRSKPRKSSRRRQAKRNKQIESLFVNPLGTR